MPSETPPELTDVSTDVVNKRDVAVDLLSYGIDPNQVAAVTKLPLKIVQQLQTTRMTTLLSAADQEIAEAMRNLVWMAYEEAVYLMQFGSPIDRIGLIKLIIGRGMGVIGAEKSARFDEMRTVFEDMMNGIREPEDTPFNLPLDDSDAETGAAAFDADYPG